MTILKQICYTGFIKIRIGDVEMAIGERIRFFRNRKGMTQKYLGMALGFPEKSADVRMAQYESGDRTPKEDLTKTLAFAFDVSPQALTVPDIDSFTGLLHTFFALEDIYGLKIKKSDGRIYFSFDESTYLKHENLLKMFFAWAAESEKLERGEITKEEYDRWRYKYPEFDTTQRWGKVPPKELSDYMIKKFKHKLK